jgi:hypothetical protein
VEGADAADVVLMLVPEVLSRVLTCLIIVIHSFNSALLVAAKMYLLQQHHG